MYNSSNTEIPKRLLSIEETANFLGISVRTIYNQTGRKAKKRFPIKPKRIGKRILFDIRDLEKFIEAL
jgi:predicted DNA-binding transcriptional regulator AlpA